MPARLLFLSDDFSWQLQTYNIISKSTTKSQHSKRGSFFLRCVRYSFFSCVFFFNVLFLLLNYANGAIHISLIQVTEKKTQTHTPKGNNQKKKKHMKESAAIHRHQYAKEQSCCPLNSNRSVLRCNNNNDKRNTEIFPCVQESKSERYRQRRLGWRSVLIFFSVFFGMIFFSFSVFVWSYFSPHSL